MNSTAFLMLGVGILGGVVIGRSLKRCETATRNASKADVLVSALGLGGKVVDWLDDDDDDGTALAAKGGAEVLWFGAK
jgi:hypothetical protein